MKKLLTIIILFFVWASNVFAFDAMNMPKFDHYVNDYTKKFSTQDISNFDSRWKDIENKTTAQVVVVLFPNRDGKELIDIWLKAFRDNWIWQKDKDNWVLLLISTEEKKIRIVTWYWLEWDIPDVVANDIIERDIRPYVNSWDLTTAINNYYTRVSGILEKTVPAAAADTKPEISNQESDTTLKAIWAWIFVWVVLSNFEVVYLFIIGFILIAVWVYFKAILFFMFLFWIFLWYLLVKFRWSWGGYFWWGFGWGWGWFSGWGWSSWWGWAWD
jgi:uncharacterized protein